MASESIPYRKCIPYELSSFTERWKLVRQCFYRHRQGAELEQFLNERPSDFELREKIVEYSGGTVYEIDLVNESIETVLRSIHRSWDIYHDGQVPASNFMRSRISAPYEIVVTEDKGRGMIASRDLKAGEIILEEFPIMITLLPLQHSIPLLYLLPQKAVEAILLLHNREKDDRYFTHRGSVVVRLTNYMEGIVNTNVWRVWHTANMLMRVLPLTGSMFNHSPRPNTIRGWDRKAEKTTFTTICDVKKGEELEIDYCPPGSMSQSARELYLRRSDLWYDLN